MISAADNGLRLVIRLVVKAEVGLGDAFVQLFAERRRLALLRQPG
jgi:hypothetical protein